jgi:hypothetical protein
MRSILGRSRRRAPRQDRGFTGRSRAIANLRGKSLVVVRVPIATLWTRDSRQPRRTPLTHRNTERKMLVVGPCVAADSESNLRTFRFSGAACAALFGFDTLSPALVGNVVVAATSALANPPCVRSDCSAPPGLRHRRSASESA